MNPRTGDKIIFHTEPEQEAVVIGVPGYPAGLTDYGLIFGTANAPDARKMTQEQLDKALADGLIRIEYKPGRKPSAPKAKKAKTKKAKPAKKAAKKKVVPPWAKK